MVRTSSLPRAPISSTVDNSSFFVTCCHASSFFVTRQKNRLSSTPDLCFSRGWPAFWFLGLQVWLSVCSVGECLFEAMRGYQRLPTVICGYTLAKETCISWCLVFVKLEVLSPPGN